MPSIATVVIIYVWRLGRFATGLFGRGALYAMIATENGGGGESGIRTGRTFRAFQFGALVVIEDTHEITKYLLRFFGGLNVQHAA